MTYNSDKPTTITIAAEMTGTVSAALLGPVVTRLKAWQAPPIGLQDMVEPLTCADYERELIKLSREIVGLRADDAAVDSAWTALVETYATDRSGI